MRLGDQLVSSSGYYALKFLVNGTIAVFDATTTPQTFIYTLDTNTKNAYLSIDSTGNLEILDIEGKLLRTVATNVYPSSDGIALTMQSDGNLVFYNQNITPTITLWNSTGNLPVVPMQYLYSSNGDYLVLDNNTVINTTKILSEATPVSVVYNVSQSTYVIMTANKQNYISTNPSVYQLDSTITYSSTVQQGVYATLTLQSPLSTTTNKAISALGSGMYLIDQPGLGSFFYGVPNMATSQNVVVWSLFTNISPANQTWLTTPAGQTWLSTTDGQTWLNTSGGQSWLTTNSGNQIWLNTPGGQAWLNTSSGKSWVENNQSWLETGIGQNWLTTQNWIGQQWISSGSNQSWLNTIMGQWWVLSAGGQKWFSSPDGQAWVTNNQSWLQTMSGSEWLYTIAGQTWLSTPAGQAWTTWSVTNAYYNIEDNNQNFLIINNGQTIQTTKNIAEATSVSIIQTNSSSGTYYILKTKTNQYISVSTNGIVTYTTDILSSSPLALTSWTSAGLIVLGSTPPLYYQKYNGSYYFSTISGVPSSNYAIWNAFSQSS